MILSLFVVSLVLTGLSWLILSSVNGALEKKYQDLTKENNKLETELKSENTTKPDNTATLAVSYYNNKKIVKSIAAISEAIPKKLWLEHLVIHDDLSTEIQGKSMTVEDIINYKESLNKLASFQDFNTAKLGICSSDSSSKSDTSKNETKSNNGGIAIIPNNTNPSALPSLPSISDTPGNNSAAPNLPSISSLSSGDCYEFVFGSINANTGNQTKNTNQPNQPAPANAAK